MQKPKPLASKVLLYILILLLPFVVFYWQVPFWSDTTIGNDYVAFPISQQMELQYSLKHGTFPLYIPGFAGGQSAAALTLGQMYHPLSHLAAIMPGYWKGDALEWNTLFRLLSLGILHLGLFIFLLRLGLNRVVSFLISFITVYNFRMLDLFHYGASLENYTGYLFLCLALGFYYLKPTRFWGPAAIIVSTYLLICGGHPQMMYLGLWGAGLAGAVLPFVLNKISPEVKLHRRTLVKYYSAAIICVLCGILLASAYTIPFYSDFILTNAQRVGQDYQFSLEYDSSVTGMLNSFFAPLQSEVQGAFGSSSLIILVMVIPFLYLLRVRVPIVITAIWGLSALIFITGLGNAIPLHYYFWKYFPLARSFRAPGRLSMLFPFLFLLVLAWLFRHRKSEVKRKLNRPYFWAGLLSVVVYLIYHWIIAGRLPRLKFCLPEHIKPVPSWLEPLIFWLGLITLLLVVVYAINFKENIEHSTARKRITLRNIVGIILIALVLVQITVSFRHGTWVVKKTSQPTLAQMDRLKKRALTFRGDPGHGMETAAVFEQKRHSILEPRLAKFYRKFKIVRNRKRAYRFIRKENVTETLVIEAPGYKSDSTVSGWLDNRKYVKGDDRVKLKTATFNRLAFSVDAQATGFFTLSFPFDKRWRAEVDGSKAKIFRGNGYLQAIKMPSGEHEIEFRYSSPAVFIGMLVSCLTFLFAGCYFGFFVFKGKLRITAAIISFLIPAAFLWGWSNSLYGGDNLETRYKWSSKDFPPSENLAYAKKTTISSGRWLFYPGLAVDGYIGKEFRTDRLSKSWWQVNLGLPKLVGEVVIYDGNFSGKKHLPLDIAGSMDGKKFKLLKRVTERGKEKPWRIPLKGEIAQFIRLDAPSKRILSFSEVEIYPPHLNIDNEKSKIELIQYLVKRAKLSEPVMSEVFNKIDLLYRAIDQGSVEKVKTLLSADFSFNRKLRKIVLNAVLYRAVENGDPNIVEVLVKNGADVQAVYPNGQPPLMMALEKGDASTVKILNRQGGKLFSCGVDNDPQTVVDLIMGNMAISPQDYEINVWNRGGQTIHEISPELVTFGKWGKFKLEALSEDRANLIAVTITEADEKGIMRLHLGYENNRNGININTKKTGYVTFIVQAKLPSHLLNRDNYIAIIDYKRDGTRKARKTYFDSINWRSYIVSQDVSPNSRRLLMMVRFNSHTSTDRLLIKDARIIVSKEAL